MELTNVRDRPSSPKSAAACASLERIQFLADYPDLLTVQNLCELTTLSDQTIRREINEGKLPGFRLGRRLFVSKQRFLEYIVSEEI